MAKTIDYSRFDLAFLHDFCSGDEQQMDYFLKKFIHQWPGEINRLKAALEAEDRDEISRIAHTLRPQLDFVGLKEEAALIFEIENFAQNQRSFNEIRDIFNRIKDWQ